METIDIKGKPYIQVNERIKYFREHYDNWSMISEIISINDGICIIKAIILDENNVTKATGLAYEKEGSTFINKTSYIENCETSAWGRALGNLGIGIDTSVASAEEVTNAINNQNDKQEYSAKKPSIVIKNTDNKQLALPTKIEDIKNYKFLKGKHENKIIEEILKIDKPYLKYLVSNVKVEQELKDMIKKVL